MQNLIVPYAQYVSNCETYLRMTPSENAIDSRIAKGYTGIAHLSVITMPPNNLGSYSFPVYLNKTGKGHQAVTY